MQEKREKGLCFRCDEKWSLNHQCKRRELSVLLLNGDEENNNEGEEGELVEEEEVMASAMGISLNSVVGISNPKTMKLVGKIRGKEVIVMVDPGATNNFISTPVVEKLGIPVSNSKEFGVTLGTGEEVIGKGECKEVELELQGFTIKQDFLSLGLGNSDVILGIQWLETLGTMTTNWKLQLMRFQLDGREVQLVGDPSLERSKVSLKTMLRTLNKEGGGFLVELNQIEEGRQERMKPIVPAYLKMLLVSIR